MAPKRRPVPRRQAPAAFQEEPHANTLLDVYQNFTRGMVAKVGINPEWIHGLDEITSVFMFAGYAVALIIRLITAKHAP